MTNKDIALELLEIKFGINSIAERQHEDSLRTDEIYDRVFKNGLVTDIEKTKVKLANIEGWKKNINKVIIAVITAFIIGATGIVFFGDFKFLQPSKIIKSIQ